MATEAEQLAVLQRDCPPGIIGNPYLGGHFPWPKQLKLMTAHEWMPRGDSDEVFECLFGGAAGGGKSDGMLMLAGQMAELYPGSATVVVRRTHKELTKPGALLSRARQWWIPKGVRFDAQESVFTFPNGSLVQFGYHGHENDDSQFQGAEYQLALIDELTMFPTDYAYMLIRSRIRRLEGSSAPLRIIASSNPGGPGHVWVKERFVGIQDAETGERRPAPYPFLPSMIEDNPSLDRAAYVKNLLHLHPTRRAQLMAGDWDARDPGDYFRAEWFGPLLDPEKKWTASESLRVRWWDLAASEADDAAYTAGVLMARHRTGVRAIEHCRSFRATPGKRDARIITTAEEDGHKVVVGLEVEPGSGGIAQVLTLERRLKAKGFRVVYKRPVAELSDAEAQRMLPNPVSEKGKAGRAVPVAACLYMGYVRRGESDPTQDPDSKIYWGLDRGGIERDGIRLYRGPWTQPYLDRVEGFPDTGLDEGDATTGAWAYLEAHPVGGEQPPALPKEREPMGELANIHPADRPDENKPRGRFWTP